MEKEPDLQPENIKIPESEVKKNLIKEAHEKHPNVPLSPVGGKDILEDCFTTGNIEGQGESLLL